MLKRAGSGIRAAVQRQHHHAGRLDLRKLPRLDGDQHLIYANENTVMYRAKAKVPQIEVALLRKLQAAGWCPYSRLNSSHNDAEDRRDLSLLRGSAELLVLDLADA